MFTDVKNNSKNNPSLVVLVEALALVMLFVLAAAYHIGHDMTFAIKMADGETLNKNLYVLLM